MIHKIKRLSYLSLHLTPSVSLRRDLPLSLGGGRVGIKPSINIQPINRKKVMAVNI